jgi:hypothetical protein
MDMATSFEQPPRDKDLLYSIEHWDEIKIGSRDARHIDAGREAFVHPRTATAARIMQFDDGAHSVQPTMGDYDNGDCVLQPDDPEKMVSGGSSVAMHEVESLDAARVLAYVWMRGWVQRNGSFYEKPGSVVPADIADWAEPIN